MDHYNFKVTRRVRVCIGCWSAKLETCIPIIQQHFCVPDDPLCRSMRSVSTVTTVTTPTSCVCVHTCGSCVPMIAITFTAQHSLNQHLNSITCTYTWPACTPPTPTPPLALPSHLSRLRTTPSLVSLHLSRFVSVNCRLLMVGSTVTIPRTSTPSGLCEQEKKG